MAEKKARLLTKKETARYLGISESCVVNWVRLKHVIPVRNHEAANEPAAAPGHFADDSGKKGAGVQSKQRHERILFLESDIQDLKRRLESGEFPHLRSRANKTFSSRAGVSENLLPSFSPSVRALTLFIDQSGLEPEAALYFLAIALFCRSGDLAREHLKEVRFEVLTEARRSGVLSVLAHFYGLFSAKIVCSDAQSVIRLLDWELSAEEDLPGSVYQLIAGSRKKARMGLFYTPPEIASAIVPESGKTAVRILDPCCGTGRLLLRCAVSVTDPRCLYGIDVDPVAVFAAAVNLLLHFDCDDFTPNLACTDFLGDPLPFTPLFDCLITNPPWGAKQGRCSAAVSNAALKNTFGGETFAQVIARGADCLAPGGFFALVLPESLLNVKKHEAIRRFLLEQFSLREIRLWGNCFPGVFSRVITLKMQKNPALCRETVFVYENRAESRVWQNTFLQQVSAVFTVFLSAADRAICEKVRSVPHQTLLNNARWALGIVTGNNRKFLLRTRGDGAEAIYFGRDIFRFAVKESGFFLRFTPELFQQTAPESKYRAPEKLIYRFISRRLIFAYDNRQRLTLNSANIVIPALRSCPVKAVAALLNSDLYTFYYQKNFHSLKVLRNALESLPLPVLEKKQQDTLCALADELLNAGEFAVCHDTSAFERLNSYVYDLFGITAEERLAVRLFLAE